MGYFNNVGHFSTGHCSGNFRDESLRFQNFIKTSSPRLKKRISNEEKENYDLASDNLCSVASDDEDDEEDDVFAAIQDVIKKPIIKIDRSILKRKSPETGDGTPRRTRFAQTQVEVSDGQLRSTPTIGVQIVVSIGHCPTPTEPKT